MVLDGIAVEFEEKAHDNVKWWRGCRCSQLDILDTEEEPNDKEVQAGDDSERNISVDQLRDCCPHVYQMGWLLSIEIKIKLEIAW